MTPVDALDTLILMKLDAEAAKTREFDDFVRYCRVEGGYAALSDVVTKTKRDEMESFVFAETFKYFYLLFAEPQTFPFDRVVFNTEPHPLRRAR